MVVLLHGVSGNRRGYGVLDDHLTSRVERGELQVLNVDLRGHGQSSRATLATYDAPSYAADIAALIDSLTDRGAILVGHSLGGLVSAALASTRPDLVRALFLEDPPFFEGDVVRRNASPVAAFFPPLVAAVRDLHAKGAPLSDYETLALTHVAPDEAAARGLGIVSSEIEIDATPEVVYALVSDVTRTGEWSPECVRCRWLGGATATVAGARYRGASRNGWRRWSTTSTIRIARPGAELAWDVTYVGRPVARWGYRLSELAGGGTLLVESVEDRRGLHLLPVGRAD